MGGGLDGAAVSEGVPTPEGALQQLNALADRNLELDAALPLRMWYRSARELHKMAGIYDREDELEKAYVLYMKFTMLILRVLPKHPDYALPAHAADKAETRKQCNAVLKRLEQIKGLLKEKYAAEAVERAQAARAREEEQARLAAAAARAEQERLDAAAREASSGTALAVSFVATEAPGAAGSAGMSEPSVARVPGPGLEERPPETPVAIAAPPAALAAALDTPASPLSLAPYPALPSEFVVRREPTVDRALKPHEMGPAVALPAVDRSTKPHEGLRTLLVPAELAESFVALAASNTAKNIETCGILAGTMRRNVLYVTALIVPRQEGTADSCTTRDEESVFALQDTHDLITLGWIHTHPSQSCFMSSVDLHTHCSYQLMLSEAVAIVCAPKHGDVGAFSLTVPDGIELIARCRLPGFHPHPAEPVLYEPSCHVRFESGLPLEIFDIRK